MKHCQRRDVPGDIKIHRELFRATLAHDPLTQLGASAGRGDDFDFRVFFLKALSEYRLKSLGHVNHQRAFVFRVCGLFGIARSAGRGGTNFVETMLRLASEGRALRVVRDQIVTPSYTRDLAPKVWRAVVRGPHGVYHLTNAGQTSWYEFAREIFRLSGQSPDLTGVTAAEYGARARRPAYSVLAHRRLAELGEDDLRPWQEALADYLRERAGVSAAPAPAGS